MEGGASGAKPGVKRKAPRDGDGSRAVRTRAVAPAHEEHDEDDGDAISFGAAAGRGGDAGAAAAGAAPVAATRPRPSGKAKAKAKGGAAAAAGDDADGGAGAATGAGAGVAAAAGGGGGAGGVTAADALPEARKVVVVLEQASLETVKTKRGFELLNCDDHGHVCKKAGRDPAEYRPDITHQLLLALLDSPLNKAGHLQIFIQTRKNVLIEVAPSTRIPRTFKRFAGLMVQLLHKLRVRAADGSETLLKVLKNPVQAHLPISATVVGLEMGAPLVDAFDLPARLPGDRPVVFVIGAMSHGDISPDYTTATFSLSRFPLSAACAVSKLLNSFEHAWGVL